MCGSANGVNIVCFLVIKWFSRKFADVHYVCGNGHTSALWVILLIFNLLIQNGDVYVAAEFPCKYMLDLLELYFQNYDITRVTRHFNGKCQNSTPRILLTP